MSKVNFAAEKLKNLGDSITGLGKSLDGTVLTSNNVINAVGQGYNGALNKGGVSSGMTRGVAAMFEDETSMVANAGNFNILQKLTGDADLAVGKEVKLGAMDKFKMMHMNGDGSYSGKKIAGTIAGGYMGVSAAGRIATGGGLYRDSSGNFNVIGVPLI